MLIDEATQATVPASLIPLSLLDDERPEAQRVVFAATNGQDREKAFKQKGMDGIVLAVPQATAEK